VAGSMRNMRSSRRTSMLAVVPNADDWAG
jgi:hypothetical protein